MRGHSRTDGLLADYCDDAMYKAHSLFSAYSENPPLEIMAYYDDVEVCNPLGSHAKKHKLGTKCSLLNLVLFYGFLQLQHYSTIP